MSTHLAAVSLAKGQPFEVRSRSTPKPGPGELLIAVRAVAVNPADAIIRETGLFISEYPAIVGFDITGLVLEIGENVPSGDGPDPGFTPGVTRIAAFSSSYWMSFAADYGAFQERVIVPWQHAIQIPDDMSWTHAATLPVAVEVAMNAWDLLDIPPAGNIHIASSTKGTEDCDREKKEALLIWGAASSVGTMGVQTARLLRDDPNTPIAAVYATAGAANSDYICSLGADVVFDYKDPNVVDAIASAARSDGLVIRRCFLATGALASCQAVLQAFSGDKKGERAVAAKIGSAPPVPQDAEVIEGMETVFVVPSTDESERLGQLQRWFGACLRENLAKGLIRPSPEPRIVGSGLGAVNGALDLWQQGVSCTKLVVHIAQ
ncbi:GroES-like protein [Xylariaceae sp. FL0016]|nr:GroES-like protein [Xylariaceae sp. FL0016]